MENKRDENFVENIMKDSKEGAEEVKSTLKSLFEKINKNQTLFSEISI